MNLRNDTDFECGWAIGIGPEGEVCLGVIVKATFRLPEGVNGVPTLADEQLAVLSADEYYEGDVTGSVRCESDAVPFKPRADVVVVGTAYVPGGRSATTLDVMLRVGHLRKIIRVFGDRRWLFPTRMVMVPVMSDPEPFTTMPLVYERAFGGLDHKAGKWCQRNFIGRGFLAKKTQDTVDGRMLPNLEDPMRLITSWDDEPHPVGLGFIDRAWQPRVSQGGTMQGMEAAHALLGLADDLQPAFYNGAHSDLQVAGYLRGDEEVELLNLTPDGRRSFRLTGVRPEITIYKHVSNGLPGSPSAEASVEPDTETKLEMSLDTLVFLPDDGVYYQVWRGRFPLGDFQSMADLEAGIKNLAEIHIRQGPPGAGHSPRS